jgi:flagellin-specific chaperone FliS
MRHINAYKQNKKQGINFKEAMDNIFSQCADAIQDIIQAMRENDIATRFTKSERIVYLLSGVHQVFEQETNEALSNTMKSYCVQNMMLIAKMNLNNDVELANSLYKSFKEIGTSWKTS